MEAMKLSAAKSWEESDSCNRHCLSSHGFVMLRGLRDYVLWSHGVHNAPRLPGPELKTAGTFVTFRLGVSGGEHLAAHWQMLTSSSKGPTQS